MPVLKVDWNKNSEMNSNLQKYPTFTAGALYILTSDIVYKIISSKPKIFTKNEDQNLGIWIASLPERIEPVHDRRIQQWHVCEEDLIAKHFFSQFEDPDMTVLYDNVVHGRKFCEGFLQYYCALCYSCTDRETTWQDWGYECTKEGAYWKFEDSPYNRD